MKTSLTPAQRRARWLVPVLVLAIALVVLGFGTRPLSEIETLERAAYAGDDDAAMKLAGAYFIGRGVPRDEAESYAWRVIACYLRKVTIFGEEPQFSPLVRLEGERRAKAMAKHLKRP